MNEAYCLEYTRKWLEQVVIGLNLCPFAAKPFGMNRVRLAFSEAANTAELTQDLIAEGQYLLEQPVQRLETTLLVHPYVLTGFLDYNDYLHQVEDVLKAQDWVGVFQVASFHPGYQFAGSLPDAVSNYTNRSPYPTLHLIREARLKRILEHYESPEQIPERNIALMEKMGRAKVEALISSLKPQP